MSAYTPVEKTDKRLALLEAAERLFAEHGFEAVSIRQLALEAGTNVAMVSYYFGSKEGLFQELLALKFPRTREALEALANNADLSPWEKLSRTIDMYVDKFFAGSRFHRVITREMSLRQRPENVKVITEHMSRNMALIRGFIIEGQEKGLFRYVDIGLTVASMFGALHAFVNSGPLVCELINEHEENGLYSETNKERLKNHLKAMLQSHLMRPEAPIQP